MDKTRITPLALAAALFVTAGGFVHLREWLETYRHLPGEVPGVWVVKVGFPLDAIASLAAVVALGAAVWIGRGLFGVVAAILVLQVGAVSAAVVSSEASLFGWTEAGYTRGVEQALAVEVGAIVCLLALVALDVLGRRSPVSRARTATAG